MHFEEGNVYHIYNRGEQRQTIFFTTDNYLFFLRKVRKEWLAYCNILSYCLMPNHFHFLLIPNALGCKHINLGGRETHMQQLSKTIGKTLSSYTQAINIEQKRVGSLFQKKTKAKLIERDKHYSKQDYIINCVIYIHLNPISVNLCKDETDWEFSSLRDFTGLRNGTLCNKELLYKESGLTEIDFKNLHKRDISSEKISFF